MPSCNLLLLQIDRTKKRPRISLLEARSTNACDVHHSRSDHPEHCQCCGQVLPDNSDPDALLRLLKMPAENAAKPQGRDVCLNARWWN
jgi:hypothetical protein